MKYIIWMFIAAGIVSCKSNSGASGGGKASVDAPKPIASVPEEKDTPIVCKSDADCPRRACGPCTPGEVLMNNRRMSLSCALNPCTNSRSICGPKGLCIVHPDTAMRERLKSEACVELMRDKWHLLCKGKTGEAATACEDIVDAATAKDDAAGCEAARAKLMD